MATRRLFAVDLGASGGKCFAGAFDANGFAMHEVHRFAHEAVPFHIADRRGELSERAYWDDTLLYQNILAGLRLYRREVADHLDALGIDTWGSDGQVLSADGECLGKMYAYRDHRLDDMIEEVTRRIDARRLYEITGVHFQPFNISNQLLWLATNRPDVMAAGRIFLPAPTLFAYYLAGARQVDTSWAGVTQLMDARTGGWSAEVLMALGIPRDVLPEIVVPGTDIGELLPPVAQSVGLNRARVIAVAAHDTASAFSAAPVEDADEALIISSGTWSLVGKRLAAPLTSPAAMAGNFSNEAGFRGFAFLRNCMGAWLVQELRRGWRRQDGRELSWDELTRLAQAAPPLTAMIDPDDRSFYNPPDMAAAIDASCRRARQPVPADRGAYLRVVFESLALKYRFVAEEIARVTGRASRVIHIVGGGCRNELLNQLTADVTGLRVVAGPEEATALGNLMAQAVALGLLPNIEAALPLIRQAAHLREFRPAQTRRWEEAYGGFRALTLSNRDGHGSC